MASSSASSTVHESFRLDLITLRVQGVYFFVLGLWPIFDIHSFQAVSGKKTDHFPTGNENDHWLVFTVGALIAVVGFSLLIAAWNRRCTWETIVLAGGSAAVLAAIDIIYVTRRVISAIYLADAAIEILFLAIWTFVGCRTISALRSQSPKESSP
jgi:hypothetical protein